jgi:hypothetical protein
MMNEYGRGVLRTVSPVNFSIPLAEYPSSIIFGMKVLDATKKAFLLYIKTVDHFARKKTFMIQSD